MARAFFTDVAVRVTPDGDAFALAEVEITVARRKGAAAQIYADETSGLVKTNPFLTGPSGEFSFWAPYGDYNIQIADSLGTARIATRIIGWDSVSYIDGFDAVIQMAILSNTMTNVENSLPALEARILALVG